MPISNQDWIRYKKMEDLIDEGKSIYWAISLTSLSAIDKDAVFGDHGSDTNNEALVIFHLLREVVSQAESLSIKTVTDTSGVISSALRSSITGRVSVYKDCDMAIKTVTVTSGVISSTLRSSLSKTISISIKTVAVTSNKGAFAIFHLLLVDVCHRQTESMSIKTWQGTQTPTLCSVFHLFCADVNQIIAIILWETHFEE